MSVSLTQVRDIFNGLETGDGGEFLTHVADNVDWTVEENPIPEPKKTTREQTRHGG